MHAREGESPIEVKALCKSFGDQRVLNGLDLSVGRGETLTILGKSGTGKSVLLKLLIGLQQPDSGSIRIDGQEVAGLELDRLNEIRKTIGFLFQHAALYDSLTVEENVAFPMERHAQMSTAQRKERVRALLSAVGMEEHVAKLPSQLSGGMQKRVGLARSLALEPVILLFDEPTAGLDPITSREIGNLILQLKKAGDNRTAVVVTHDLSFAKTFTDRFILMDQGHAVAEGTLEDLQESQDAFAGEFLRAGS